jgi:predicted metal-dependent hydrolase
VVVPEGLALADVEPFLEEKRPWIERTLRRMREAEADRPPVLLENGGEVPYLGSRLELAVKAELGRTRAHVARRGDALLVKVGHETEVQDALERWYRREARREIGVRLDIATARAGTPYTTLSIRGQRTRWASCSSSGAMSFNWRLLLAPEEILDYVVEHEVAHLEIHDHSERFWKLLEGRSPDSREYERWLRLNGPTLRFP